MRISRPRLQRGLLLAHGLIRGALGRGWDVEPYDRPPYGDRLGVAIVVRAHRYPIEVHEETRTLPFSDAEIEKWRNEQTWDRPSRAGKLPPVQLKRKEPTGRLRLVLPHGYRGGRATWTDGSTLTDRLDCVFGALERRALDDDEAAAEGRRRTEELRLQQERREELAWLGRIDGARYRRAVGEMKAWRDGLDLARYAAALRARLPELELAERVRIESWCDWIDDRVRRSDPTRSTSLIIGFDDDRDGRMAGDIAVRAQEP